MITACIFKSANTIRITLPRPVRNTLDLHPSDHLLFTQLGPDTWEIRSLNKLVNSALPRVRK